MPIFSFEIQQEYFVILFALERMDSSAAKLAYLRFLAKAAVVAAGIASPSNTIDLAPPQPPAASSEETTINSVSSKILRSKRFKRCGELLLLRFGLLSSPLVLLLLVLQLLPPIFATMMTPDSFILLPPSPQISMVCAHPSLPQYFLPWTDLKHLEHLTDGDSSIIYTAYYKKKQVVAKILKKACEKNELHLREIQGEIEMLQRFNHPNIIKFYGSGTEPRMFVVTEVS